jgi:hypothetical protein
MLHYLGTLSFTRLLELLYLRLPIVLWVKAQYLPSLLDTDQSLSRILGLWIIVDTREDLLD